MKAKTLSILSTFLLAVVLLFSLRDLMVFQAQSVYAINVPSTTVSPAENDQTPQQNFFIYTRNPESPPVLLNRQPAANSHTAVLNTPITIQFDQPISLAAVLSRPIIVHASQTGVISGALTAENDDVQLTLAQPFKPGEWVQVSVTTDTQNYAGEPLIAPLVWQFRTAVSPTTINFINTNQTLGSGSSHTVNLGDFDQDGDLDAFVTGFFWNENQVWFNDGQGIFTGTQQAFGDSYDWAAAVGDLDGDGDLDAVTGNYNFGGLSKIWTNNGSGYFTATQAFVVDYVRGLDIGDVDGDGDLDILFTSSDYPAEVWLNNGAGYFTDSGQSIGTGNNEGVRLGDLDNDGDLDAFINGTVYNESQVWLNDGAGIFTGTNQTLGEGFGISLGDVDNDGDLDALTCNHSGLNRLWLNSGNGYFTASAQTLDGQGFHCTLADLDGDGDLDAMNTYWSTATKIWLNDGTGHFYFVGYTLSSAHIPALGDFDADGDLDVFLGTGGADQVWLNGGTNVAPISGLQATNSSPTTLGAITLFTATVAAGSSVLYTWDLGDGSSTVGPTTSHVYTAVGAYTATLHASNSVSTGTVTTTVFINTVPATLRWYVNWAAPAGGDGSSWANAFDQLQDALAVAQPGNEIWVASGVYTPGILLTDSFQIPVAVQVYGGFIGNETDIEERNWQDNPTVMSGDIGGDDVTNVNGVVLTTTNIVGDNAYHVVTLSGTNSPITETTRLDGFVITAGDAHDSSYPHDRGGGLFCNGQGSASDCSPALMNLTFIGNKAASQGGAIYNDGTNSGNSSPILDQAVFDSNVSLDSGGAMYNAGRNGGNSSPTLTAVKFTHNTANETGGGLTNDGILGGVSSPVLTDVIFLNNKAQSAGAMFNWGFAGASHPSMTGVTFQENAALFYGGAIYNDGNEGSSSPLLINVSFYGNTAAYSGGAMYSDGRGGSSSPILTNVLFHGNSTMNTGGAMENQGYMGQSSPQLTNVSFSGNHANFGGALVNSAIEGVSKPTLINVTFSHNTAIYGGAILNDCNALSTCQLLLTNTILWANEAVTGTQIYNSGTLLTVTHSLIDGGWDGSGIENVGGVVVDGGGNLSADALFQDADGADNIFGTADDDLRLRIGSPAIDSGDTDANTTELDAAGQARLTDGDGDGLAQIDMGAYEAPQAYALTVTLSGTGRGSVSSEPGMINCGLDCVDVFVANLVVTLTAVPQQNSVFSGWSGACSGNDICVITMDAMKEVTAVFSPQRQVYLPYISRPGN